MHPPEDYRLQHTAPCDDGYSTQLRDARTRFGSDVLDQPDLYGAVDDETLAQMRVAVEDPDAVLRIYRAVPPEHLEINTGDWVTLSRAYAHDHGYREEAPAWPVVYADVPAGQVWTDGNDPSEYGYGGPNLTGLIPHDEHEPLPAHPLDPAAPHPGSPGIEETMDFRPSPGAHAERRIPPTTDPGHDRAGPQR
ncbi:MAG: hypothetical protein L0H74_00230 [Brachybacterium sp.]|nr:hypothetical protein [Brachybacterium sp.]